MLRDVTANTYNNTTTTYDLHFQIMKTPPSRGATETMPTQHTHCRKLLSRHQKRHDEDGGGGGGGGEAEKEENS